MKTDDNMNKPQKLSRKMRKILVEKKRRERIDKCLKQIKDLLFQGTEFQHDYMRMEKADILENVVKFLQCQTLGDQADRSSDYRLGFMHCMKEVQQVLDHVCGQTNPLTLSINQYLHNRLNETCTASTTSTTTTGGSERLASTDDCIKQELLSPTSSSSQAYDRSTCTRANPSEAAACSRVPPIHPLHALGHMTCYGGSSSSSRHPEVSLSEESFSETFGEGQIEMRCCGVGVEGIQVVPTSSSTCSKGSGESSKSHSVPDTSNNNNDHVEQQQQNELHSNMWRPW